MPPNPKVICHCLLLEDEDGLVDTGIGLLDVQKPLERIGQPLIDTAGFQFHEEDTAVQQVEELGFRTADVTHVVLTHCDPDHVGGLEARPVALGFGSEVLLVPLFGRTLGHCGVAVRQGGRWMLHVGDAYYLRVELTTDEHPVSIPATQRADDDDRRKASLGHIRRLVREHRDEIDLFGYHDPTEFPQAE